MALHAAWSLRVHQLPPPSAAPSDGVQRCVCHGIYFSDTLCPASHPHPHPATIRTLWRPPFHPPSCFHPQSLPLPVAPVQACHERPSSAYRSTPAAAVPNWNSATNHFLRPGRRRHDEDTVQPPYCTDMGR